MQIMSFPHFTGGGAGGRRREPEETADTTSVVTFLVISLANKLLITFFFLVHFYTLTSFKSYASSGLQLLENGKNDENSQAKITEGRPVEMHHGDGASPHINQSHKKRQNGK